MTRDAFDRKLAERRARLDAGEREAWATVNGFASYEVSNWGFVRNRRTGRILKPFRVSRSAGYLRVSLFKARGPNRGRAFHRYVHRLVAVYHVPGRTRARWQVHHVLDPATLRPDLDRTDADGLVFVTPAENLACRGEPIPGGGTGPGRPLAEVRAELAEQERAYWADLASWRADLEAEPGWIPAATEAPF